MITAEHTKLEGLSAGPLQRVSVRSACDRALSSALTVGTCRFCSGVSFARFVNQTHAAIRVFLKSSLVRRREDPPLCAFTNTL